MVLSCTAIPSAEKDAVKPVVLANSKLFMVILVGAVKILQQSCNNDCLC